MNNTLVRSAMLFGLMTLGCNLAQAKLNAEETARLGKDLTPTGAEKAGNAAGTIPAWEGGLTAIPAGYKPEAGYADPFANEKPLFTVTSANVGQYAAVLSDGYKALIKQYPRLPR